MRGDKSAQYLIENHLADVNATSALDITVDLHVHGHTPLIHTLYTIKNAYEEQNQEQYQTALSIFRLLLGNGADPAAYENTYTTDTPLHTVMAIKSNDALNEILFNYQQRGIDFTTVQQVYNSDDKIPLMTATSCNYKYGVYVCSVLFRWNDEENKEGDTAHYIAYNYIKDGELIDLIECPSRYVEKHPEIAMLYPNYCIERKATSQSNETDENIFAYQL